MAEASFPKNYHCPSCGSEKTVIGMGLAPLKMSGEIPLDAFACMERKAIQLVEPSKAKISVPTVITCWDICWECGTYYCNRVEMVHIPIQQPGLVRAMGKT